MENFAVYATMRARAGREEDVQAFLERLLMYAEAEEGTKRWFALRGHERTFAIFDTFNDRDSRTSHLEGRLAQELMGRAAELFEDGLQLVTLEVVAEKDTEDWPESVPN